MSVLIVIILSASAALTSLPAHAIPLPTSLQGWSQRKPPTLLPDTTSMPAIEAPSLNTDSKAARLISDWTLAPPVPISIMEHSLVSIFCDAVGSHLTGTSASIILIGGSNASGSASASVYSFSIDLNQWLVLKPMPEPRQAAMAVFSQTWGGVIVCGGRCQCKRCVHPSMIFV
jgi:hypothetical protein